ncbi:hypothetical protein [Vibrio owensii]|uniref:hypothetical protein n=1 Tax=Vibrio owensii TaxID=696485 RepID=UPI002FF104F9
MKLKLILGLIFLSYLILKPFYFWSSGLPQISDLLLALSLPFFILDLKGKIIFSKVSEKNYFSFFLFFIFYCFLVNLSWSIIEQDPEPLIYSLYLAFNFYFITLFYYLLTNGTIKSKSIIIAFFSSSLALFVLSFVLRTPFPRQIVTFNNPNQLASYSMLLIMFCLYIYLKSKAMLVFKYKIMLISIILINSYLIAISLSAGALLSVPLSFLLLALYRYKKYVPIVGLLSFALTVGVGAYLQGNTDFAESVNSRIEKKEGGPSIIYERGYDRIFNHPEYTILGAGEGLRYRLKSFIIDGEYKLELHSTVGTLFFSYGFIASFLIFFVITKYNYRDVDFFLLLIAMAPYLLTHNLLRHPFLWMFLFVPLFYKRLEEVK